MLRPKTTGNNVRQYTQADIENVKAVYNLVKVRALSCRLRVRCCAKTNRLLTAMRVLWRV